VSRTYAQESTLKLRAGGVCEMDVLTRIDETTARFRASLRKYWWGFLVIIVVDFTYELLKHRVLEATNRLIDQHVTFSWVRPALQTIQYSSFFHPLIVIVELFALFIFLMLIHAYWETRPTVKPSSLLRRTRAMVKKLRAFVDENEGDVTRIHFLYDARFRIPVDNLFSELAAEEVCDILEGDWVINPQIQTASNIRESVIPNLVRSADRLEAKRSAPRSKLVGEIESGKITVHGESVAYGKRTYTSNVCVTLRVTNQEKIETTVKRANAQITIGGKTYRGTKTSLWYPKDGRDLLEKLTSDTPIRHGVATVGSLEFTVEGLKRPDRGIAADVTVTLVDEFDLPHKIRNKSLWIAA
jgi:hypothetical protein